MLIIGAPNAVLPIVTSQPFVILNMSSNLVAKSIPSVNLIQFSGVDYSRDNIDAQITNAIFSNDMYFCELMKIVFPLFQGRDVALLVYREDDIFDPLTEIIGKIIQQRYGYNYQLINEPEDWQPFDQSSFDINGVFYLDQDIARYNSIMVRLNPKAFIDEKIDDSHF